MDEDSNAEKIAIQIQLNRLHDEWIYSVTKGDLESSDRLWCEMVEIIKFGRCLSEIAESLAHNTYRIGKGKSNNAHTLTALDQIELGVRLP